MPKIKVNGITLHHITTGAGPDLVMLHGFLGNLAVWHLEIVPKLRTEFRVVTYDLRGHGYSEVTPDGYTPANMAEDLKGLLDEFGIGKAHIVGHSYGADIALYFALKYPERVDKLVALEPGLAALVHERKHESWEGWDYWVSKLEEVGLQVPPDKRTDVEYLLNLSLETPKFYGPARGLPRNRGPLIRLLRETSLLQDYEDVGELTEAAIRTIKTRILLIYGDKSHFLGSYEFLKDALPNCETELLPGGEHFGPLEHPDLLVAHMSEFLRGNEISPDMAPSPALRAEHEDGTARG